MFVACQVAYAGPKHRWYVLDVDENEYQVSDARYYWHRADAINDAVGQKVPVTVYDRQGNVRKTIAVR